jgi:hypothetical protein
MACLQIGPLGHGRKRFRKSQGWQASAPRNQAVALSGHKRMKPNGKSRLKRTITLLLVLMIFTIIVNCSQHIVQVEDLDTSKCLPFLQDDITRRQEISDRLGVPINSYEDGRIISYLVFDGEISKQNVVNCEKNITGKDTLAVYNLVLVFGQNNVLRRHSLVRVR